MGKQNKRRLFLKQLFSCLTFGAASTLSYKSNRYLGIEKSGQHKIGIAEAHAKSTGSRIKKIACEEHGAGQDDEKRLKLMDDAGIDIQVVQGGFRGGGPPPSGSGSTPSAVSNDSPDAALGGDNTRSANDELAEWVRKYPGRFAGYFSLNWLDPDAACAEFERAVKDLKLAAPMVYAGQVGGLYMDDQKFWPIYETAEKLDVPVYIHPGSILPDMKGPYESPYQIVSGAMWGFSASTSLHAVRLIVSGVFDKYPKLKIILGHLGEGIPYWLWRMDNMYEKYLTPPNNILDRGDPGNNLKKPPSHYFKENFYIVTSGMFWEPPLQLCIKALGADRILFGCDYPPEPDLVFASQWIDSVEMSDSDREKIFHINAEKLFKL